ncbi:rhombotarget lipoprotein [Dongshaea marina]|uniref:rhombotarget lipoprotein n=1 Tax=Dongshaea marina TaxID=2047966 RepID=UPI000D3EB4DE|nr:rhombotarget lipoprotein [Dongshaea marina]
MKIRILGVGCIALIVTSLLGGCAVNQSRQRTSIVDYLYPKNTQQVIEPSIPTLKLPLSVGIAFVPNPQSQPGAPNLWSGRVDQNNLTEETKMALLQKVQSHFEKLDFVSDIQLIPSAYLTPEGGFNNLNQIQNMFGIDEIALVSYDQVQFTDEGALSLTYWTLIGAYVVSGEKNDTSTMLDTAVYDIKSQKMLFRAPGMSRVKGSSTLVNLSDQLRKDSVTGFNQATEQMIKNLDIQLKLFKEKVKSNPDKFKVEHKKGYTGGGAFGPVMLILLLIAGCIFRLRFRQTD